MSNNNNGSGNGGLILVGLVVLLFIVQAIITAINNLINSLINLLFIVAIIIALLGALYAIYWFLIRPNTVNGRREQELKALIHHEQVLTLYQRCSEVERGVLISPDLLHHDKQFLQLKIEALKADIQNKSIPMIELELKLKQLEILMKSRFNGNSGYTAYEEYKG